MGIPNWNKVAATGLLQGMLDLPGLKFRVSVEEWARVTGTSLGYIEIDVEEALENVTEQLEDASMNEIIEQIMEHYYEYGYEYDMELTQSFSIDEYQDSDREVQDYFFTVNGNQRNGEEIQRYVEERREEV